MVDACWGEGAKERQSGQRLSSGAHWAHTEWPQGRQRGRRPQPSAPNASRHTGHSSPIGFVGAVAGGTHTAGGDDISAKDGEDSLRICL